ncbi:hypothetical protein N0V90_004612 [Kalmusia sp. IMI 367209]|nr:hypothetical protein N0V90_004612 [Kalmusia sp. IMI 367209]
MLNYLPIAGQAAQLVAELLFSGFSDFTGKRLPFLLLHSAINITSLSILIVRPANEHAYMAGWYLNYIGAVSTMLLCAWASAHLQHEPEDHLCRGIQEPPESEPPQSQARTENVNRMLKNYCPELFATHIRIADLETTLHDVDTTERAKNNHVGPYETSEKRRKPCNSA